MSVTIFRTLLLPLLAFPVAAQRAESAPSTASQPTSTASTQPASPSELAERAAGAENRADYGAAADAYLQLCQVEPGNPKWFMAAGNNLGRVGRFNDCLDLLEKVRPKFPELLEIPTLMARTLCLKARAAMDAGTYDIMTTLTLEDAARIAGEILQRYDGHQEARLILAQTRLDLGQMDQAMQQAEEVTKRFPAHPGGFILVGQIAFTRYAELRQQMIDAKPSGQEQVELSGAIGKAREQAETALTKAVELDANRPFPLQKLGDLHAWSGSTDKAAEFYQRALSIDASCGVNHEWLRINAPVERRLALYEAAGAAYLKRPDAKPSKAAALYWYAGYARFERKEWKVARTLFEAAVQHNPSFQNSHYYAMLAAYWDGDHQGAEDHAAEYGKGDGARAFADVIAGFGGQGQAVPILEFLARRAYEGGRVARSRDINHVLAFVQNDAQHWNNYAFLCRETGLHQESLEGYERALELEPESPQLLNDAAVILQYHLREPAQLDKARDYYERAIRAADKVLGNEKTGQDELARARTARRDAQSNLARLPKK